MKDLKQLCDQIGLTEARTYIQSGNVLFFSKEENKMIEQKLRNAILQKYHFEVPVIVVDQAVLVQVITKNPFLATSSLEHLHLTFLEHLPSEEKLKLLDKSIDTPDQFVVYGQFVFVCCHGKYHQSKLTNNFFEKKLGITATTRNWKTVLKLSS